MVSIDAHEPYVVSPPAGRLSVRRAPPPVGEFMKNGGSSLSECNQNRTVNAGSMLAKRREISRRAEDAARIIIGARAAGDRVVVRADQKDFTVSARGRCA